MPSLANYKTAPNVAQDSVLLPGAFPEVPEPIIARFGDAAGDWNVAIEKWWKQSVNAISDANDSVASVTNNLVIVTDDLIVKQGALTASITTETNARIAADGILAQRIVTVSALAGKSSNIKVQGTPPGGPALNDIWVDNAIPQTPVTYTWDGGAWVEVTEPISVAAVAVEQTARITADGNLASKYTLTVVAGNVVTGMNITSASGPGTNISSVIFSATDFQIYNGVSGYTMFDVSGTDVRLAGTLVVNTAGQVYIGTGTYANTNTAWYVDSAGNFSLKNNLTWNGTTLTIQTPGQITTSGNFLNTSNLSYTTWQGPAATYNGMYLQRDGGGATQFNMLGVRAAGGGAVGLNLCTAAGSFGALSDTPADAFLYTISSQTYSGGAFTTLSLQRVGVTTACGGTGETPYFLVTHTPGGGTAEYLVWNYDNKLYFCSGLGPNSFYAVPYVNEPLANLYRSAAATLKTDGSFVVGVGLSVVGAIAGATVKATTAAGFISSDGSTGYTGTVTTASLVGKTLTIKDGIITSFA